MTNKDELAIRSMDDLARISDMFAKSGYFTDARDAAQIGVKILAGQGWGIQPFDAVSGIFIIEGKPSIGAGLMASQVKASGRYDYRVREMTEQVCRIEFFEGGESLGVSEFTLEDAKTAGAQFKTSKGYPTAWSKFPRNMLFARAMSNGVRWYCPDVFNSPVYVPEELGADVNEDGDIIDVESRVADPVEPHIDDLPAPDPDELEAVLDGGTPHVPMMTGGQRRALMASMRHTGFAKDADVVRGFISYLAGRQLASSNELTKDEAASILDLLGSDEGEGFRADPERVTDLVVQWEVDADYQRSVNEAAKDE